MNEYMNEYIKYHNKYSALVEIEIVYSFEDYSIQMKFVDWDPTWDIQEIFEGVEFKGDFLGLFDVSYIHPNEAFEAIDALKTLAMEIADELQENSEMLKRKGY